MTRDRDQQVDKPERVVIVDADHPLTEIRGEFVWLEEHQRAVAAARDAAFSDGFDAGVRQAEAGDVHVHLRRRRTFIQRLQLGVLVLLALLVVLMLPVVLS